MTAPDPIADLPDPLPLFPLQTVLFPGAVLPLRVFEARYLDLITTCMRTRQPFGVVCLRTGAEAGRSRDAVQLEDVGVLATVDEVETEQANLLRAAWRLVRARPSATR